MRKGDRVRRRVAIAGGLFSLALALGIGNGIGAAPPAGTAEPERVELWPAGAPGAVGREEADRPSITVWGPEEARRNGAGVVVCPGGGYGHLALGHEGRDIAVWLNSLGVTAFVLRYRIAPRYHYPAPLLDVQRALRAARSGAERWKVDPHRLGIIGFSAGGHLASSAGTHFDAGDPAAKDPIDRASSRPDFMILLYPVITFREPFTHRGSRNNFLGERREDARLVEKFSNEEQVTADTPPAFLVHTGEDPVVPCENSLRFYLALHRRGIPAELHLYEKGPHGFGLAPGNPILSTWPGHCRAWLEGRGFLPAGR